VGCTTELADCRVRSLGELGLWRTGACSGLRAFRGKAPQRELLVLGQARPGLAPVNLPVCQEYRLGLANPGEPAMASIGGSAASWLFGSRRKAQALLEHQMDCLAMPNVRVNRPAEASTVSLVRDDAPCAADQAYGACRSGSG
jgi:hypothetical protein